MKHHLRCVNYSVSEEGQKNLTEKHVPFWKLSVRLQERSQRIPTQKGLEHGRLRVNFTKRSKKKVLEY